MNWVSQSKNKSRGQLDHDFRNICSLTVHKWWLEQIRPSQLLPGLNRYLHTPMGNFPLNRCKKWNPRWVHRTIHIRNYYYYANISRKQMPLSSIWCCTYKIRYPKISAYLMINHLWLWNEINSRCKNTAKRKKASQKILDSRSRTHQSSWSIPTVMQNACDISGRWKQKPNAEETIVTEHMNVCS